MTNIQPSFCGKLTIRTFDNTNNSVVVKHLRTKKQHDSELFKIARALLNPKDFDWTRKNVSAEQTASLDIILEKILNLKLPDNSFHRSMYTTENSFFYMIVHPNAVLPNQPSPLLNGGVAIDFIA